MAEDRRMPPAAWEVLAEDTLTTDSSFPSSLTSRVRMSSSNTAIVLLRSAARKETTFQKPDQFVFFYPRRAVVTPLGINILP